MNRRLFSLPRCSLTWFTYFSISIINFEESPVLIYCFDDIQDNFDEEGPPNTEKVKSEDDFEEDVGLYMRVTPFI